MRAFVTGGSGFLGQRFIRALRAKGHEVAALARSARAAETVTKAGAEPVNGDLHDVEAMRKGMVGCEVAFHSAAHVGNWGRYQDFYRDNVEGTQNVLSAALGAGLKRLIHVSTEAVLLGGRPIVNADETWPRPARPLGLYALTKGLAEERVLAANAPDFQAVIVRPRFIWGQGDTTLLPRFVKAVKSGQWMWLGGGRYLTSTCHVNNVCEGMMLAAEHGRGGEIYFLTDGAPVQFREFLTKMLRTQGVEPGKQELPYGIAVALATVAEFFWRVLRLKGEPFITRTAVGLIGREVTVNDRKARRELSYTPSTSIDAGLQEMADAVSKQGQAVNATAEKAR